MWSPMFPVVLSLLLSLGSAQYHGLRNPYAYHPYSQYNQYQPEVLDPHPTSKAHAMVSPAYANPHQPHQPAAAAALLHQHQPYQPHSAYQQPSYLQQTAYASYQPAYQYQQPAYHAPEPMYHNPEPAYHTPQPAYRQAEPAYHAVQPAYHAQEPAYRAQEPAYHAPQPAYHAPEPAYHAPQPAYHAPQQPAYHAPEPAYHAPEQKYAATQYRTPASPSYEQTIQAAHEEKPTTAVAQSQSPQYLGTFKNTKSLVEGDIFKLDDHTLYIQGFSFDGNAPDAYFWSDGVALPYYTRSNPKTQMNIKELHKEDVVLMLPPEKPTLKDLKHFQVWCKQYGINFGEFSLKEGQY